MLQGFFDAEPGRQHSIRRIALLSFRDEGANKNLSISAVKSDSHTLVQAKQVIPVASRSWTFSPHLLSKPPPLLARAWLLDYGENSMKNFQRVLRIVLRHKLFLAGTLTSAFLVAVLWGGNIGALYPMFEVILGSDNGKVGQ